jgi:hypothetical protein
MCSFASSILRWLWPSRPYARSLMCEGTARQIARRFVAGLELQDGYNAAAFQQHLIVVVNALRASGLPVTRFNMVKWALPGNLEVLHRALHVKAGEGRWLGDYLNHLPPDLRSLFTQMHVYLAARFEFAEVPSERGGSFAVWARELGGALVDLVLREVCLVLLWVATILVYAAACWVAFDRLGLAAISLEQCVALGLLLAVLVNALTGRTDALARRIVNRINLQL